MTGSVPAQRHSRSLGMAAALGSLGIAFLSSFLGAGVAWASGTPVPTGPLNFGGSGGNSTLSVSSQSPPPGGTESVGIPGIGPCSPGSAVTLWIVLTQPGSTPTEVGPTSPPIVANATGGFAPVTVTIPSGAVAGVYVLFAMCTGSNGLVVITKGITVVPISSAPSGSQVQAGAIISPPDVKWQPPSAWSDPTTRRVVGAAVDEAAASVQPGAGEAPAPLPNRTSFSGALAKTSQRNSANSSEISVLATVLLALLVGTVWLRRWRHPPADRG